jgi:hypothetical protein
MTDNYAKLPEGEGSDGEQSSDGYYDEVTGDKLSKSQIGMSKSTVE